MKAKRKRSVLPEVTLLSDARGTRPENAVVVGDLWYEPEVWSLPLSPAPKILYAGLCSFLGHRQINRKDLRNILKNCPEEEIEAALQALVRHRLLMLTEKVTSSGILPIYEVRSVDRFDVF